MVVVVVVERKTIEMWWWWWWWWWRRENNWNVVVVVLGEENNWILSPENLYKCATFYLFLSLLHLAPEGLTWVGSVLSAKNPLVEKIVSKGTWCLNTARLVSPHFKQFQCFHRNVSGFASSILSPLWLPEWLGPEKRPGFDLYCNKLQRPFTIPRRGSFDVIHNGSLHIHKC